MPYRPFMLSDALCAACWLAEFRSLGFVFGGHLPQLAHYVGPATWVGTLVLTLVVGLVVAGRWFVAARTRLVARTELVWQRVIRTPALQRLKVRHPRAWTLVAARFARGQYLGLHLTIGLAISVAGLWLFGGVTEDVIHHDSLTQFDATLLGWGRAHATPAGYAVFNAISLLGSAAAMTILALGVAFILALQRQWIVLGGWVAAFAGGGLLDQMLKVIIRRPRPPHAAAFLPHPSWSFPSGHAMGSLIGYGMLAYLLVVLWTHRRSVRISVVLGAALLIGAVGLSRLYLGVHYFSDVIGGYAAGVLWLSACVSGIEVARRRGVALQPPARPNAH
jgi:undecaprenyl-diphosphatase